MHTAQQRARSQPPASGPTKQADGRAQAHWLPGSRLHLSDGPIDLILWAEGDSNTLQRAFKLAQKRFETILDELVDELPVLRGVLGEPAQPVRGAVAQRMVAAASCHRDAGVTPMIAVAGAVADEVLETMKCAGALSRAYVNNGGDIALHAGPGTTLRIGAVPRQGPTGLRVPDVHVEIEGPSRVSGIATSGAQGRSLSLGIADSVTVLAGSAAGADAAATLIANAVNVDHPLIERCPARDLDPDSDLGTREVTLRRGPLPDQAIDRALDAGAALAQKMLDQRGIFGAHLTCDGQQRMLGFDEPRLQTKLEQ